MKKRIKILLLSTALCVFGGVSVSAQEANYNPPRVYDGADILTDSEERSLMEELDEISLRQECDVAVATVESTQGKNIADYTDDFYDYNGYGQGEDKDGILFLVSMNERKWYITTTGYGIAALTDAGREYIADHFLEDLSDGEYAKAFATYARLCDEFLARAASGTPYDKGDLPKSPLSFLWIPGSLFIGFVLAFLVTLAMKSQLKSVRKVENASNYVKKGSMRLLDAKDIYLYSHIDRVKIETNTTSGSRTHVGSSGTKHGGGGGSF